MKQAGRPQVVVLASIAFGRRCADTRPGRVAPINLHTNDLCAPASTSDDHVITSGLVRLLRRQLARFARVRNKQERPIKDLDE